MIHELYEVYRQYRRNLKCWWNGHDDTLVEYGRVAGRVAPVAILYCNRCGRDRVVTDPYRRYSKDQLGEKVD